MHQPEEEKKTDRKIVWLRRMIYLLGALLVFHAGMIFWLRTDSGRDTLRRLIISAVESRVKAACRIGEIRGNLLGDVDLVGFELRPTASETALLSVDRARISFRLLPLLAGRLWVSDMQLSGARLHVEQSGGTWNAGSLISPDRASEEHGDRFFRIDIRKMVIDRGTITIAHGDDASGAVRRSASIDGRFSLSVGRLISVRMDTLAAALDDPHIVITDGSGGFEFDPGSGRIGIQSLRLAGEASVVEIVGELMTAGESPVIDIRSVIRALSLQEIGRALNLELADIGVITGEIDAAGPLAALDCRISLETGGSGVHFGGIIGADDFSALNFDVAGRIVNVDPSMIPVPAFQHVEGGINAELAISGRYLSPEGFFGTAVVDMGATRVAGYDVNAASMGLRADGPDIAVEFFRLDTPYGGLAGRAEGRGMLSTDHEKHLDLTVTARDVDPALLFPHHDVSGKLNFLVHSETAIAANKTLAPAGGRVHARILPSVFMDSAIRGGEIEAAWDRDRVSLNRLLLEIEDGKVTAAVAGSWRDGSYRGMAAADFQDLKKIEPVIKKYVPDSDISGRAILDVAFDGRGGFWNAAAEIRADNIAYQSAAADTLHVKLRWRGDLTDFAIAADTRGQGLKYSDLRVSSLDLTSLWTPAAMDADLTMKAATGESLALSGNIYDWAGPVRKIQLNRMIFTSDELPPLVSEYPARAVICGDRLVLESLKLISREASFTAGGDFGFVRPNRLAAEMALENVDLQMISGFFEGGHELEGRVTAHMALSGFADDPAIDLSATVLEGAYKGFGLTEAHFRSTYKDAMTGLEASFFGPKGKLMNMEGSIAGRLTLYPFAAALAPETLALSMAADDMPVSDLAAFWESAAYLGGRVSGYVNVYGLSGQPVVDASIYLKDVTYRDFKMSRMEISGTYQQELLQMQATGFIGEHNVLDAGGTIPVRFSLSPLAWEPGTQNMRVGVNVDGFDISIIDGLIRRPEYAISGIAHLAADIGGPVDNPIVTGQLSLRKGTLRLKPQRLFYSSLEADLEFGPDVVDIKEIRIGEDAGGVLALTGFVEHERFSPGAFDIHAVGTELQIPFYAGVSGRMNPDLRFDGTWDAPSVNGDVRINRGRVNLDVLFSQQPSEIKVIEPMVDDNGILRIPDQKPPALAFVDPLRANVTITVADNVWLRGVDDSIQIRGRVHVEKEPGRSFVVYGPLTAVTGTYRFRGKIFKITSGELNFIGQDVIDPPLNIQAETRIGDVRIIIYLSGTYERLNMRFDSDPPMDEVDIISYLIFGRPQTSLTEGESFRAGEAALAITGQIAADEIRDILGDRFRIDYIDISAGSGGFQHGLLSMGKYLTPNLFVIYRHSFASETPQQVEVYYEINRHFSLETQINDEKTTAVDLIWKYEF